MTTATRLQGIFSPVLTPFNADSTPDPVRFVKHCRWLLDQDVGLAAFGTNSEANSMSVGEKRKLLDALLEAGVALDHSCREGGAHGTANQGRGTDHCRLQH